VHRIASQGFGECSSAYEQGRPSYPPEAVTLVVKQLGISPGTTVIDLGAGTGKLTRLLLPTGARVIAIEPVGPMRETLARVVPEAEVHEGTAESMPLPDGTADAAVVGQAFHWFDAPSALAELARVLRPGGGLALLWNTMDESTAWVAEMLRVIAWHESPLPKYPDGPWQDAVQASERWTDVEHAQFGYSQEMTRADLDARVRSVSYIAQMAVTEQQRLVDAVLGLVAGQPDTFPMPYVTDVYWCRTLPPTL
jgi:SAM-dependent methyltransferase